MAEKKEWVFLGIVMFIGLLILMKTVRFENRSDHIKLTVTQQKGAISTLDTLRKVSSKKIFHVSSINFPQKRMLEHKDLGKMGYSSNFFIDATTKMSVVSKGKYRFTVRSDDGFRLKIDDKVLCEYPGHRPMTTNTCTIHLSQKDHIFQLSYWQGGGPLGLSVKYHKIGTSKHHFVGDDSKNITFKESK